MFHGLASHTLAAVSSTGVTNAAFSYTPFGEVVEAVDAGGMLGADSHSRRFNDKYHDDLSKLVYYGARYYDPIAIAWSQADPLFRHKPELADADSRKANLYSFSLHNPLRYHDPDGLSPCQIDPAICAGDETPWAHADGTPKPFTDTERKAANVLSSAVPTTRGVAIAIALVKLAIAYFADDSDDTPTASSTPSIESVTPLPDSKLGSGPLNGNSKASDRSQHSYDIVRKPGGTDPPGVVKVGVSGRPLNQDGTSGRANGQVNKLNASEKGKNEYEAVVTKKDVTPTKTKSSRARILDYEKNRAAKKIDGGQPMDKHQRPRPKPPKKE
jgi:RHS repeat-associated protein